ncbi:hypothetical protein Avbf_07497 [Armadillidium vulgare]|nr:hypothetical protein Avbf_07497 [Armadillidium vulgare]
MQQVMEKRPSLLITLGRKQSYPKKVDFGKYMKLCLTKTDDKKISFNVKFIVIELFWMALHD